MFVAKTEKLASTVGQDLGRHPKMSMSQYIPMVEQSLAQPIYPLNTMLFI